MNMAVTMRMRWENITTIYRSQKMGKSPVDTFFANFNWGKSEVDYSISTAKWINRNPYDVLAGLELQKEVLIRPMSTGMPF